MSIIRLGVEEGVQEWERRHPRQLSDEDWQRFEGYVSEILEAMGMNLDTPGTRETPQRYLHAVLDATRGYEGAEAAWKEIEDSRKRAAER